jgi:cephalosporin hydroxylase
MGARIRDMGRSDAPTSKIEKYFDPYPLLHGFKQNFPWNSNVNHANPFYSPMYYIICRHIKAKNIVEVGCMHGYSSYMFARAAMENGGKYVCVEKSSDFAKRLKKGLVDMGAPHEVICADSKDIDKWIWGGNLQFVLMDGEHTKEAIEHEVY